MQKVSDWTAKRAGGRITVTGKDEAGKECKIVGVDRLGPTTVGFGAAQARKIIAVDRDGKRHELV